MFFKKLFCLCFLVFFVLTFLVNDLKNSLSKYDKTISETLQIDRSLSKVPTKPGTITVGCIFLGKKVVNLKNMVESIFQNSRSIDVHLILLSDADSWDLAVKNIEQLREVYLSNHVGLSVEYIGKPLLSAFNLILCRSE